MNSSQSNATHSPPLPRSYYSRFRRLLIASIPLGFVLCFLLSAVITFMLPKMFVSTAVIQVSPKDDQGNKSGNPVSFFLNEFQTKHREEIVKSLAQSLDLGSRWGMTDDEVRNYLNESISLKSIKGTELVVVAVKMIGPVDARDVAKEYFLTCEHYDPAESGVRELEDALQDHQKQIQISKQKIEGLKQAPAEDPLPPEVDKANAQENYTALSKAKNLDDRLLVATQMIKEMNIVKVVYLQYLKEEEKLRLLAMQHIYADDPRHQKQQEQVGASYIQLTNALNTYRNSLKDRANGVRNPEDISLARNHQIKYAEAELLTQEQQAELVNKAFADLKTRLAEARLKFELKEEPKVPQIPVSPNVQLNLMAGMVAGVTVFPLLVLLLTWMYHLAFPAKKFDNDSGR